MNSFQKGAKMLALVLSFMMVFSGLPVNVLAVSGGGVTSGSSFEDALDLEFGIPITLENVNKGDYIYYKIVPETNGYYNLFSTGEGDTWGCLYNANQEHLVDDEDSGENDNFMISYELTAGETYYLSVKSWLWSIEDTGSFSVIMNDLYAVAGDCGSDIDISAGESEELSVKVESSNEVTYQWYQYDYDNEYGIELSDENSETLVVTKTGSYYCLVRDEYCLKEVWFDVYVESGLTVSADNDICTISKGEKTTLSITASTQANTNLTYEWYYWNDPRDKYEFIEGNVASIIVSPTQSSYYKCFVSDSYNSETVRFHVYVNDNSSSDSSSTGSSSTGSTEASAGTSSTGTNTTSANAGAAITGTTSNTVQGASYTANGYNATVTNAASDGTGTVTITAPVSKTAKKAVIPATVAINGASYKVTAIANNAFKNCKNITSITIGSNVTKIGKNAFSGCKKLKTITIKSKKLKSIGNKAFTNINKKATFKVPKSKKKAYKKLLKSKVGFKKTMKIK